MYISSKILKSARIYYDLFRRDGLSQTAYNFIYEMANKITPFSVYRVFLLSSSDINPHYADIPDPFFGRFLSPDEALHNSTDPENDMDMDKQFVLNALDNGEECFGVFKKHVLCSYAWYSDKPCHVRRELFFHFKGGYKYQHKGYTYPKYRGLRLHGYCKALACSHYTRQGYLGLMSIVESHKVNSLRSHYRLGNVKAGKIAVALIGGRYRTWADSAARSLECRLAPIV